MNFALTINKRMDFKILLKVFYFVFLKYSQKYFILNFEYTFDEYVANHCPQTPFPMKQSS